MRVAAEKKMAASAMHLKGMYRARLTESARVRKEELLAKIARCHQEKSPQLIKLGGKHLSLLTFRGCCACRCAVRDNTTD